MLKKLPNYFESFKRRPYWFIRLVLSRLLLISGLSRFFIIRLGDVKLRFFPTRFSADLWFPAKNIFADYNLPFLREGGTVIDVGANIGVTVLLFKKYVGSSGKIYAFEPDPKVFEYLKENIELNKLNNVFLFNRAVGERKEMAYLQVRENFDTGNAITFNKEDGILVDMDCLDDLIKEHRIDVVDLLKVDTEGYEKFVFHGGKETLSKTNFVIFEAIQNNCQRFNYHILEIISILKNMNFRVYCCNAASGVFEEIDVEHYLSSNDQYLYDLFAVKDPSLINGVKWC